MFIYIYIYIYVRATGEDSWKAARTPFRGFASDLAPVLLASCLSGKQRDPNLSKISLIRKQCCKCRMEPLLHVDGSFLAKELSSGSGSLSSLLIFLYATNIYTPPPINVYGV